MIVHLWNPPRLARARARFVCFSKSDFLVATCVPQELHSGQVRSGASANSRWSERGLFDLTLAN